jgi:Zn-dependent protease
LSNLSQFIVTLSIWAVPTVFAIVLHEVMHGYVANLLGDDTAARAGRLTLNPLNHVDPIGTIVMPALLLFLHLPVFGYAKPVPVDFRRLSPRRAGMIAVAAAGPLTNLALAVASAFAARSLAPYVNGQWGPADRLHDAGFGVDQRAACGLQSAAPAAARRRPGAGGSFAAARGARIRAS